jgi:hypothetical protein
MPSNGLLSMTRIEKLIAKEKAWNECAACPSVANIQALELFDAPFNLAGELLDNSITAEGEARVRALAESEARKAQQTFTLI